MTHEGKSVWAHWMPHNGTLTVESRKDFCLVLFLKVIFRQFADRNDPLEKDKLRTQQRKGYLWSEVLG